jgi:hypothetical protein
LTRIRLISDMSSNATPFEQGMGKELFGNEGDPALGKSLFDDRSELLELLEGEVDDMCNPDPTFLMSLKQYLSLDFSEEDILSLACMVSTVLA